MFKTPYSINIIILSSNVKGGRSFFLTFLSFKNNDLAKKFVNMLTKKPFNINDLARGGHGGLVAMANWRRPANHSQLENDSQSHFILLLFFFYCGQNNSF